MRALVSLFFVACVFATARQSVAEPPAAATVDVVDTPSVVRISFARNAAEKLNAIRLRRLVELQLGAELAVDPEPFGPLDENVIRVFIELETDTLVRVQAQAPGRRLESRPVDVEGVPWEVATRFVAITASELVKSQATPPRKPRPRELTPFERATLEARVPRFEVSAALETGYWEAADEAVFGSRLRVAHHTYWVSESLSFAALAAPDGSVGYDLDLVALHQFWIDPSFRLSPGAGLSLFVTNLSSTDESFRAASRVHAIGQLDLRIDDDTWFRLAVEPGLTLDPELDAVNFWMTGAAAIAFEAAP